MKIFSENVGILLSFLVFGIPDEPPSYVRQCSTSGDSLLNWLVKEM